MRNLARRRMNDHRGSELTNNRRSSPDITSRAQPAFRGLLCVRKTRMRVLAL